MPKSASKNSFEATAARAAGSTTRRIDVQLLDRAHLASVQGLLATPDVCRALYGGMLPEAQLQAIAHMHLRAATQGAGQAWVLSEAGEPGAVLGYLGIFRDQLVYAIRPELRRLGWASMLLRHGCQACAAPDGVRVLNASVLDENAASARLLEANGFRFAGHGNASPAGATGSAMRTLEYTLRVPPSRNAGEPPGRSANAAVR